MPNIRRLLHGAATAAAAVSLAAPACAAQEAPRVVVSAREARVIFPRDTATTWGWPGRHARYSPPRYTWAAFVDGMDGLRVLEASTGAGVAEADTAPRTFPSLDALVRAGSTGLCRTGMIWECDRRLVRASVEDGRVVLALRDPAWVARLFGLLPARVFVRRGEPGVAARAAGDSVRVEYVEPLLPPPTPERLAEAARLRRAYQASIRRTSRDIVLPGADPWGGPLVVEVGDTATLGVSETSCQHDVCGIWSGDLSVDGWRTDEPSVASIDTAPRVHGDLEHLGPTRHVVRAHRVGRTTVRVAGVHGASDTMPNRVPPPTTLARELRVLPRVGRVEVVPRSTRAAPGDSVRVRVRAVDVDGREIADVPTQLRVVTERAAMLHDGREPVSVVFERAGRWLLVGTLLRRADSVVVDVAPRARP